MDHVNAERAGDEVLIAEAPIYIVSGWIRSGTSMMMQALVAGGLPAVYSDQRNRTNALRWHDGHYSGNPDYFELTPAELFAPDFPLAYKGQAVKCVQQKVLLIPGYEPGYRIAYMRRDPEEIRQSMQALFNKPMPPLAAANIERDVSHIIGILQQRRDVLLIEIPYREALASPRAWLGVLAQAGWPIDADEAAAAVDPAACRYRREELHEAA